MKWFMALALCTQLKQQVIDKPILKVCLCIKESPIGKTDEQLSTRSVLQQTTQLQLTVRSRLFVSGPCMSITSGVTSYMMRMPDSSMIILCTASVLPFKMVLLPRRKPEWKMYCKTTLTEERRTNERNGGTFSVNKLQSIRQNLHYY